MKISACVITKNEAENIKKSILSYKDSAFEIIVVDTGSNDDTVEIAKKLGAKVYEINWINDFAYARNYALDRATGDWIIFLDADEYFYGTKPCDVRGLIEETVKDGDCQMVSCDLFNVDYEANILASNLTYRIFKNEKNLRYEGKIHEYLCYIDNPDKMVFAKKCENLKIYHTGYIGELQAKKAQRNLNLLLDNEEEFYNDPKMLSYITECFFALGNYGKAVEYADKAISCETFDTRIHEDQKIFRAFIYKIDSMNYLKPKYTDIEIKEVLCDTVNIIGTHPEIKWLQAKYYIAISEPLLALDAAEEAFLINSEYCDVQDNFFTQNIAEKEKILEGLRKIKNMMG